MDDEEIFSLIPFKKLQKRVFIIGDMGFKEFGNLKIAGVAFDEVFNLFGNTHGGYFLFYCSVEL
jgi:hypothetical protein